MALDPLDNLRFVREIHLVLPLVTKLLLPQLCRSCIFQA